MFDATFEKKKIEIVAHILNKLLLDTVRCIITVVEGMATFNLSELKQKICSFYTMKFKDESKDNKAYTY